MMPRGSWIMFTSMIAGYAGGAVITGVQLGARPTLALVVIAVVAFALSAYTFVHDERLPHWAARAWCWVFGHAEPFSEVGADAARRLGLSWHYRCPRCELRVSA